VIRRRLIVVGRVQGVGFRVSLLELTRTRGVAGWVQNNPDGTLEAVLEGPVDAVDALVAWCGEGPRGAVVDRIDLFEEEPEGLAWFEIR
jgi:acylphosphatase